MASTMLHASRASRCSTRSVRIPTSERPWPTWSSPPIHSGPPDWAPTWPCSAGRKSGGTGSSAEAVRRQVELVTSQNGVPTFREVSGEHATEGGDD
jgi:hypothetical protein